MKEETFTLILHAGNSKSSSMEAIEFARKGEYDKAEEHMEDAQNELNEAHRIQTELIFKTGHGVEIHPDILMVHAQDHLTAAMVHLDLSREIIHLYRLVREIKGEKVI